MTFRVQGLEPEIFSDLIGLPDDDLVARGVTRVWVNSKPGFPDRVAVRDLEIGESALLLNYEHQPADTPYRSRHAIFVGERSRQRLDMVDALPDAIRRRPISLRAYDQTHEMVDAHLCDGSDLGPVIERFFGRSDVAYLHAHYATRGCFAATIVRA